MTVTVDERGRILIPKELRDAHGLSPGAPVIVESGPDGIRLRAALDKQEALDRLAGCIRARSRARRLDLLSLKDLWEPRV